MPTKWAETMAARQAKGQCRACDKPASNGRVLCANHARIQRDARRRLYAACKRKKICMVPYCGFPAAGKTPKCPLHMTIQAAHQRAYRERQKGKE